MIECKYCNDTRKIILFTSVVDCDCVNQHVSSPAIGKNNLGSPRNYRQNSNIMNGWYSPTRAAAHGSVVYRRAIHKDCGYATIDEEVEITEISIKSTPCYNDHDLEFVGMIDGNQHIRGCMH